MKATDVIGTHPGSYILLYMKATAFIGTHPGSYILYI